MSIRLGPQCADALHRWDEHMVARVVDAGLLQRHQEAFRDGICWSSDYSGYDAPFLALEIFHSSVKRILGVEFGPVLTHVACDFDPLPRSILASRAAMHGGCVLRDLNDRLPQSILDVVDAEESAARLRGRAAAAAFYRMLDAVLHNDGASLFQCAMKAPCVMHDQDCYVNALASWRASVEDFGAGQRPLVVNSSGITCVDWTGVGGQERFSGRSERPHAIWLRHREAAAAQGIEDVYFSECSTRYPVYQKQVHPLASTHHVLHVEVDPTALGHPVSRKRMFSAGISKATYVWVGAQDNNAVQEEFAALFHASLELGGDAYLCASEDEVRVYNAQHARQRKRPRLLSDAGNSYDTLVQSLGPGAMVRLETYRSTGAAFADVEQNELGYTSRAGNIIPTMLRHGTIVSFNKNRLVTQEELWTAQGVDVMPQAWGSRGASPLRDALVSLPSWKQKRLRGNSVHIPTAAAWIAYVLGKIRKVDLRLPESMTDPDPASEDS